MLDSQKNFEYYTGIRFREGGAEFTNKPTTDPTKAFEVAKVGSKSQYHSIIFYIKCDNETKSIPYSEIKYLETSTSNLETLEDKLIRISQRLFEKKE